MLGRELTTWQHPFGLLSSFRRDVDELFNRFFGDGERAGTQWAPLGYSPQVESYTEGNTLHIKADLPGIDPNAVEITVEGNQLTLKGERKMEHEAKEGAYREVRYGSFVRTFPLPAGVSMPASDGGRCPPIARSQQVLLGIPGRSERAMPNQNIAAGMRWIEQRLQDLATELGVPLESWEWGPSEAYVPEDPPAQTQSAGPTSLRQ